MPIEFHCEHCNKLIKAPDESGGRTGKCPHCHSSTYIPRPALEDEELDLAPLDMEEENKQRRAVMEDAALQRKLLHERSLPGEPPARGAGKGLSSASTSGSGASSKVIIGFIVSFVEAMSAGKLDKAEEVAAEVAKNRQQAIKLLEDMSGEDLGVYGLPTLPKPVLLGFLKQLRAKL